MNTETIKLTKTYVIYDLCDQCIIVFPLVLVLMCAIDMIMLGNMEEHIAPCALG